MYHVGMLAVLGYNCKDAHFALPGCQEVSSGSHILLAHSDRELTNKV